VGIKQTKVLVDDVVLGMFVSGLDRPWTQTPFPLQGFYLRAQEDIEGIKRYCRFVYIDTRKGRAPLSELEINQTFPQSGHASRTPQKQRASVNVAPIPVQRNVYSRLSPLSQEVERASRLNKKIDLQLADLHRQAAAGETMRIPQARELVVDMVDSVLGNPDALSWLTKVQDKSQHIYEHCLRASIWALIFGRYIGLSKPELQTLTLGVLLKDVGKINLPAEVLINDDRSKAQQQRYESYVNVGVGLLRSNHVVGNRVVEVVQHHRERINGSGFPQHLRGDKISLLGKIAGLVGFYDEVTNPKVTGGVNTVSPSKAVSRLYDLRGTEFQEDLVLEFIRAVGLYPTGSLVELNSGEVGVVVEQNYQRRLRPKVMLVYGADKKPLATPRLLDLAENDKKFQRDIDRGKQQLSDAKRPEIARDLEPESYSVDIAQIRDNYLFGCRQVGLFTRLKNLFKSA